MNLQSKTDEELNVMLARLLGWRAAQNQGAIGGYFAISPTEGSQWDHVRGTEDFAISDACPRYCSFLDEVARVEAGLTDEEKSEYAERYLLFYSGAETREQGPIDFWKLATASARQRTIGLIEVKRSTLTKTP